MQLSKGFGGLTGNGYHQGRADRFTVKRPAVEVRRKEREQTSTLGAAQHSPDFYYAMFFDRQCNLELRGFQYDLNLITIFDPKAVAKL